MWLTTKPPIQDCTIASATDDVKYNVLAGQYDGFQNTKC